VTDRCDVAVIGAGPAGCAAARVLAQGGAKTVLLERERLPRYKTCGGGLVHRAVRAAGVDLTPVVERPFSEATINLHSIGQRFLARRPYTIVSMTMRARLDQHLANAAVDAGAELRSPCGVRHGVLESGGVNLETDGGRLTAGIVIGADGALGETAKWAGWRAEDDGRLLAPALEYEVTVDEPTMQRVGAEARFDIGTVPWGYAWVFPKKHGLSIGVFSSRRGVHDLRHHVDVYLARLGIDRPRAVDRHGYVIPLGPRRRLARGPVVLVGDAAGVADPVTAEGISNALVSGRLAAEAILSSGGEPARLGETYHAALARELLPELRRARRAASLLYEWPRVRNVLFRSMGSRIVDRLTGVFSGEKPYP